MRLHAAPILNTFSLNMNSWEEFLPTACDLIAEVFEVKDWEREPTHWVKLFDRTTQEW